jgi:hypothetical protein
MSLRRVEARQPDALGKSKRREISRLMRVGIHSIKAPAANMSALRGVSIERMALRVVIAM